MTTMMRGGPLSSPRPTPPPSCGRLPWSEPPRGTGIGEDRTPSSLILDQNYINTKNQVIKAERRVLKELGFCVHVKHPHKIIVMYLQVLECEKNQTLVQTAWNYMNDSLRTNVFVRFQAETIACACIYLAARALQIPLPSRPHWFLLFGASEDEIKDICLTTLKLYTRKKPNYDQLEKEVERRKVFLAEAKLKAKGLNPDGTPALSTLGGFSPASKPSSPNVVKVEEKSPQALKPIKKEPDNRTQLKSPHNGLRKEVNSRSGSRSRSRTRSRSRSRSPRRHYNSRRSRSGTYSSRSRSRSHSRSPTPRRHQPSPLLPHLKSKSSHHSNSDSKLSGRHSNSGGGSGHKRKRSRSRSRSRTPVKADRDRDRERERERDRERSSFDLSTKKHKHERGSGHRGDRRERERSRSYDRERERDRSHKSKHHGSGGHSGHSRHRR
ncbi:cyclin-L1a isoform X2 [Parambassis ranga]|uniref:Cyclin-L1a isoform X2 n=1 Tax=Parambassis ranga TaxID=210632 RepID=A0A6P7JCY9_9TELE|nr:cyclin-L1 isoform X2 [Parambassis ranga]